jgi:hypothetical protein
MSLQRSGHASVSEAEAEAAAAASVADSVARAVARLHPWSASRSLPVQHSSRWLQPRSAATATVDAFTGVVVAAAATAGTVARPGVAPPAVAAAAAAAKQLEAARQRMQQLYGGNKSASVLGGGGIGDITGGGGAAGGTVMPRFPQSPPPPQAKHGSRSPPLVWHRNGPSAAAESGRAQSAADAVPMQAPALPSSGSARALGRASYRPSGAPEVACGPPPLSVSVVPRALSSSLLK